MGKNYLRTRCKIHKFRRDEKVA